MNKIMTFANARLESDIRDRCRETGEPFLVFLGKLPHSTDPKDDKARRLLNALIQARAFEILAEQGRNDLATLVFED